MSVLSLKQVNAGAIALFVIDIENGRKRSRIALDLKRLPCGFFRRLRVDLYCPLHSIGFHKLPLRVDHKFRDHSLADTLLRLVRAIVFRSHIRKTGEMHYNAIPKQS